MPEGPEVRTLVDQLKPAVGMRLADIQFLSGRYTRHGKPKGFETFQTTMTQHSTGSSSQLEQQQVDMIEKWSAKGKFIWLELDNGTSTPTTKDGDFKRSIWITLGMSGRFLKADHPKAEQARWYIQVLDPTNNQTRNLYYHDTRNFGTLRFSLSALELEQKLQSLGPDILEPTTSVLDFLQVMDRQRPQLNICKFLMDQKKLCGVGNYILAEGLYRSNIDPFAAVEELDQDQREALFRELQDVALESYGAKGMTRAGGGSYRDVDGNVGGYTFDLQCYGRETCPKGNVILRETNGPHGRTIWYVEDQLFAPRSMRDPDMGRLLQQGGDSIDKSTSAPSLSMDTGNAAERLKDGILDPGWKDALSDYIASNAFSQLAEFIAKERGEGETIFPPEQDIFSALNLCPLDKVKVVIVGQDPYHGPGQGHGLAFSVRKGIRPPPSLKNIFKELMADEDIQLPAHGYLECWANQGVLLLNTVLTVRQGEANSHAKHGWEEFTDFIIQTVHDRSDGVVFLLWGGPAAKKAKGVDQSKHVVIQTSHPSPLGASKTKSPFLGSRCFSRTNKALTQAGKEPIIWDVT